MAGKGGGGGGRDGGRGGGGERVVFVLCPQRKTVKERWGGREGEKRGGRLDTRGDRSRWGGSDSRLRLRKFPSMPRNFAPDGPRRPRGKCGGDNQCRHSRPDSAEGMVRWSVALSEVRGCRRNVEE